MPEVVRGGVWLHWSEEGSGPCVLWHTGGAGDGSMWKRAGYLRALPDHRHLLLDHRGHGLSGRPAGLEAHRLREYVEDVRAVLDEAEVSSATLVGYSSGGVVAFNFAAAYPDRVAALVVLGGVSHPDDTFEGWLALAAEVRGYDVRSVIEDMAQRESERPPGWLLEHLAATDTEMFALQVEAWAGEPNEFARLPLISAPTLIICGERENTDGAAELAVRALPDGAAMVLPGLGHLQAFWRTDLTAPAIATFLARRVTASSDSY